jgi:hypothetical protein
MIRGRKRKPGSRHPCGKRIHAETEREIMQTAIDARQRHYGITARQARCMPVPHPRSLAGLMTTAGIVGGSSAEPDDDLVARLRDRFNAATDALDDCDRAARMERGRKPSLLLYRVVCVDEDTTLWPACDLGNLRLALNTLVRAFGMRD